MKNKQFLLGALFMLLIFVVFGTGRAYAVGCFTDTNAAAACWLKANGIATAYPDGGFHPNEFLTRIDAANFLFRANKVPPRQGVFHILQPLDSLVSNGNFPNGRVEHYSDSISLTTTATGTNYYQMNLSIPSSMYGRAVFLKGVQFCYDATSGGASLKRVELTLFEVNSSGVVLLANNVVDTTTRTDKTCRQYMFATPSKLSGTEHAVFITSTNFTTTSTFTGRIMIRSITAILAPSLQTGVLTTPDVFGDFLPIDPATSSGTQP